MAMFAKHSHIILEILGQHRVFWIVYEKQQKRNKRKQDEKN